MHGAVVHFEFHLSPEARRFYEAFGWQFRDINIPGSGPYTMAITNEVDDQGMPKEVGAINGGVMPPEQGQEPNTVLVLQVDEIEQAKQDAINAGGQLIMDTQSIGEMGLYARVKDPNGNTVGLWQPLVG